MNLKGSLVKLQKSGGQFYLKLAQLFESNQLISDTWIALAHDMDQQAASMDSLPSSFWKKIGSQEAETLANSIRSCTLPQMEECTVNRTINGCFGRTLDVAEPLILRAYVPIIRHLRSEFSDQALELYIMVKAHVARLDRVFQQYAGDPILLQRVTNLHVAFEHEVQMPAMPPSVKKAVAKPELEHGAKHKSAKKPDKTSHPLGKGVKHQAGRNKALTAKIELPRRRAQR